MQYALQEQKNIIYYMYDDDLGLGINFQILSKHPLFQDDCVFLAMYKPPLEMFQGLRAEMLPNVGVVPVLDPSFTEGNIN
jgi:hypothetical protein